MNVEILEYRGKKYIEIIGLAESLREEADKEVNKDIAEYMKTIAKRLMKEVVNNDE